MSLHKEVIRNEQSGIIDSSIDYVRQMYMKKSVNPDVKEGFNQAVQNIRSYQSEKVDNDFMTYAVQFHNKQERELKNKQSFDKKLNRVSTGRLLVYGRLADLLGEE